MDKPIQHLLTLQANSPLNGFDRRFGTTLLKERPNLTIHSIALASGNVNEPGSRKSLISSIMNASWPECGLSTIGDDGGVRLLGLQQDQVFALSDNEALLTAQLEQLSPQAYVTNQSDSWVKLQLAGPQSVSALERICQLDLHPSVFEQGCVARTAMEHMAVIILCQAKDDYLLLSPTSSAHSFLQAVEVSLKNVHE